jgi:hypothetical protein
MLDFSRADVEALVTEHAWVQLVLVLTEDCNLRCTYCYYSGAYPLSRNRTSQQLSVENGKKALDMFFAQAAPKIAKNPMRKLAINFYGGEPMMAQRTLAAGVDQQVLSIWSPGEAVWVSLTHGCTSGGCVRKTLVLDPETLAVTATLPGTVRDLFVSGTRAYALFDDPNEVRVYDLAAPLHPAQLAAIARPASATSIAYEGGRVHVLGDRLYTYAEGTLALITQRLTPVTPDDAQRLRMLDDICREGYQTGNAKSTARFLDANKAFHVTIAQAAGNARLAGAIEQLLDEMTRLLHLGLGSRNRSQEMQHEHRTLVKALSRGDGETASGICREQIEAARSMVLGAILASKSVMNLQITADNK